MTIRRGLDYAGWRPPSPQWLIEQGYSFVVRYIKRGGSWGISGGELQGYQAAGLDVVLNYEWGAQDMLGGYSRGQADGAFSKGYAEQLGAWPCCVYYSADFDATPEQQGPINDYLRGAADAMGGVQWAGCYGGYWVVKRALDAGVCALGWQTFAWSGGRWDERAQLRQVATPSAASPGFLPTGYDADQDVAMVDHFGQLGAGPAGPPPLHPLATAGIGGDPEGR